MVTNTVIGALSYLAGICDGAQDRDGVGFSGSDSDFGKDLARKGAAYGLTEKQHAAGLKLAHKYRKQLGAGGYDLDAIASEAWVPSHPRNPAEPVTRVAAWGEGGYARINRYAGRCCGCGARVEAGDGVTRKGEDGKWAVRCSPTCGQPEAAEMAPGMQPATQMVDGHRMAAGYNQPDEPMVRIRVVGPNGEALA